MPSDDAVAADAVAMENLLDDDDVAAAKTAQEPEATPEPEPTPAAPEPEKAPDEGELDRGAGFREAMQEMLEHVPEEKRAALKGRIEQAERHFGSAQEVKELKGRFGDLNKLAKGLQERYNFDNGAKLLEEKGAVAFLQAFGSYDWSKAGEPEAESTEAEPDALEGRLAKLEEAAKQRATDREEEQWSRAFAAEFDPAVKGVVDGWKLGDEAKGKVGKAFADFAEALYVKETTLNPDNPESVTVTSSVAKAADIVKSLVEAHTAKRPTPPRPTIKTADAEDEAFENAQDQMDKLDFGPDMEEYARVHRGG